MATSAKFTVTKVANSSDIVNNTSKIKVVLKITASGESWNANDTTKGKITIDGVKVASLDKKRFYKNSTTTIYNAEHTVQHEASGAKEVEVAYEFDTHIQAGVLSGRETLTLDTIPREAKLTVAGVTLGKEAKIQVDNPSSLPYTIRYVFGAQSGVVVQNGRGSTASWTPPLALASEIPGNPSGRGTLIITTYSDGAELATTETPFTAAVPDSLGPVINSFTPVFRSDNSTVNGWGVGVKGKTRLGYAVNAVGQYGASVTSCTVTFAGDTRSGLSGETGTLLQAGQLSPKITVTDSRGKSTVMDADKLTVYDYTTPSFISSSVFRSDESGNEQSNGTYVTVKAAASFAPVGGRNSATLKVRRRVTGGTWGAYSEITAQSANVFPNFSKTQSYEVEIVAVDAVGEKKSVEYLVPTESVAFHLKEGGNGAAFGHLATRDDALDMGWPIFMNRHKVTGLPAPTEEDDATPKDYVDGIREEVKDYIDGALAAYWKRIYPVGSIYLAYSHDNPAELFGGTWVRIENAFLWAIDEKGRIGITGGEVEHTLTVDELPSHTHTTYRTMSAGSGSAIYVPSQSGTASGVETTAVGGGQAHNNMPPFIQVSAWRRTA